MVVYYCLLHIYHSECNKQPIFLLTKATSEKKVWAITNGQHRDKGNTEHKKQNKQNTIT